MWSYDETFGADAQLHPKNIIDHKKFEIVTPDVSIKVSPDRSDLIQTRTIGGIKYLLICADENGKLEQHSKHRGRKKAISTLIKLAEENIVDGGIVYIGYTNNKDESNEVKAYFENKGIKVFDNYIDHTMGAHCGPRTLAIFYISKN